MLTGETRSSVGHRQAAQPVQPQDRPVRPGCLGADGPVQLPGHRQPGLQQRPGRPEPLGQPRVHHRPRASTGTSTSTSSSCFDWEHADVQPAGASSLRVAASSPATCSWLGSSSTSSRKPRAPVDEATPSPIKQAECQGFPGAKVGRWIAYCPRRILAGPEPRGLPCQRVRRGRNNHPAVCSRDRAGPGPQVDRSPKSTARPAKLWLMSHLRPQAQHLHDDASDGPECSSRSPSGNDAIDDPPGPRRSKSRNVQPMEIQATRESWCETCSPPPTLGRSCLGV